MYIYFGIGNLMLWDSTARVFLVHYCFQELLGFQGNNLCSLFDSYELLNFNLYAVVGMERWREWKTHDSTKSVLPRQLLDKLWGLLQHAGLKQGYISFILDELTEQKNFWMCEKHRAEGWQCPLRNNVSFKKHNPVWKQNNLDTPGFPGR